LIVLLVFAQEIAPVTGSFRRAMTVIVGLAEGKQPWFWGIAGAVAAVLLFLNVAVIVAVHARRVRQYTRGRRAKRFHVRVETLLAELGSATRARDPQWLGTQIRRLNSLERPIAATMLIERMKAASEEERKYALEVLRESGAIEVIVRSSRRWMPWRRALAVRTLGWVGAEETVPVLIERASDRNRYVRESAVRALGRIGDPRALSLLSDFFRSPGSVGAGVVYDALLAFGRRAEHVFAGGLHSPAESVRVASTFGVAALSEPQAALRLLEPLLNDDAAPVRGAAAESLGQVGGELIPEALARASRDEQPGVRNAATGALGSFDDPRAVELAVNALLDPDRDTAVRAGEALVLLSRRPAAGEAAMQALRREETAWPVERALIFASLGAV
jgi:HEAT repeat protein